ncbi:DUF3108 domain-containing protein [bacterium]|nr:DUF3108 domain-containing protein [bacterium]MBU1613963.1 DUF3108 domain-containing protein [bacterium]
MKEHINLLKICVFCGLVFSSLFFTSASFAHSFEAGEELIYDVKVMGIKAGVQKMKCAGIVDYKGQKAYQLMSETGSTSFFSLFYKVCDKLKSIVEAETLLPFYFEKDTLEGGRKEHLKVEFDQKDLLAKVTKMDKDEVKEISLPAPTFDILSLTYFLRTKPLELGDTFAVILLTKDEPIKTNIEVVKTEEVETRLGKFKTVMVRRKDDGEHIAFWFSRDSRRIPVKIEVETQIGTLSAVLKRIKEGVIK